jgi:hypothetical protein
MRSVNKTLFALKHGNDFLLVQIYVDDIIFGGSSHMLVSILRVPVLRAFRLPHALHIGQQFSESSST